MNTIPSSIKPVQPEALSMVDACRALSVCRATLYGEINAGRLRSYVIGSRRYIAVTALRDFIREREEAVRSGGELPPEAGQAA